MEPLGNLVLDFSRSPKVLESLARERRNHLYFAFLGTLAAVLLIVLAVWNGANLEDFVFIGVGVLLLVFVASSLDALMGFTAANPGLRVFELGLALPWRSRKAAAHGAENVALFREIGEIRVLAGKHGPNLIVAWKDNRRPHSFLIESKWIPDGPAVLKALRGRVPIREQ